MNEQKKCCRPLSTELLAIFFSKIHKIFLPQTESFHIRRYFDYLALLIFLQMRKKPVASLDYFDLRGMTANRLTEIFF